MSNTRWVVYAEENAKNQKKGLETRVLCQKKKNQ